MCCEWLNISMRGVNILQPSAVFCCPVTQCPVSSVQLSRRLRVLPMFLTTRYEAGCTTASVSLPLRYR